MSSGRTSYSLVPRRELLAHRILHVLSQLRRDGDESQVGLRVVTQTLQERCDSALDFVKSTLVPLDSRIIHLIDHENELGDAAVSDQQTVLLQASVRAQLRVLLVD